MINQSKYSLIAYDDDAQYSRRGRKKKKTLFSQKSKMQNSKINKADVKNSL